MNSRLRLTPPKQILAERSGSAMKPMGLPFASKIFTPYCCAVPIPQPHHRLPSTSQRKPSGRPTRLSGDEGAVIGELIVVDVIDADYPRGHSRFDDVELLLVRRESQSIRPVDVAGHHG